MTGEEFLIFAVPIGTFLAAGVATYFAAKARSAPILTLLGLLWAGFTGTMFFGMEQASGWDGFGYVIALAFLAAPAGAGLGLGGLVGWLRGRRMIHA
ncbi:hypothetical protein [Yoonia sp. SDW83-1]|uniref:hypothetical protein n=1 Tax=Yoonia sp. SDW83-1 TaxID=3366945 RepID=UPI00398C4A66